MALDHITPGATAHPDYTPAVAAHPDYTPAAAAHPDYTPAAWPAPVPVTARRPLDPLGTRLIPPAERPLFTRDSPAAPSAGPTGEPPRPHAVPARTAQPLVAASPRPAADRQQPRPLRTRALRLPFTHGGETRRRRLVDRIRTPLLGCHRITVLGRPADTRRGGVTVALGALLARHRPDHVVVLDLAEPHPAAPTAPGRPARPDAGARAGHWAGPRTPGELFAAVPVPEDPPERPAGRLDVLAVRPDLPSPALDADRYRQAVATLSGAYPLVLTDASAAPVDVQRAAAGLADQLVICADASAAGAAAVSTLLDRLAAEGHGGLVAGAVSVFTPCPPAATGADRPVAARHLAEHFGTRCRGVIVLPPDAPAGPRTRAAHLDLAALIGDALPGGHHPTPAGP
ncbi:hypothetical protein ACFVHB_29985 [Kitasatospora sp. NPDC127111]|uniref:hypothetical protein n=1 Tax=Kitasatospora sp. NPDC127111 TaxID=3345363 RepID=UPI003631AB55